MVPLRTRSTTARVVSKKNSSIGRGRPSDVCSQHAGEVGWMNTRASRRFNSSEDRLPRRITEVGAADVGEQREPVHVEVIAAVGDLGDGGIDVGQRQRGEQPEPPRMVHHGAPTDLVHLASEISEQRPRHRSRRRATRSTAATSRCPGGPSRPHAPRPTSPAPAGSRRAGRDPPSSNAVPVGRAGGSGRGRRSSSACSRVEGLHPVEQGVDERSGFSPCIEWPTSGNERYSTGTPAACRRFRHPLGLLRRSWRRTGIPSRRRRCAGGA